MHHLDSNIVVAYLNGHRGVCDQLKRHGDGCAISAIVLAELRYGAWNSTRQQKNLQAIDEFLALVRVADFDSICADIYGRTRVTMRRAGNEPPRLDLLIAATALTRGATLVADNTRDFEHIPGIQLENWLR